MRAALIVTASISTVFLLGQARLPYVAIHDPQFIPAAEAAFMNDNDRLIGIMSGNIAKAYPAGILSQHGLVEDRGPSGPIAITW